MQMILELAVSAVSEREISENLILGLVARSATIVCNIRLLAEVARRSWAHFVGSECTGLRARRES